MHDLKLTRIWLEVDEEDEETLKDNIIAIHPSLVHFYEEYVGSTLEGFIEDPLTKVQLYGGDIVILKIEFDEFYNLMSKFRDIQAKEGFFKNN